MPAGRVAALLCACAAALGGASGAGVACESSPAVARSFQQGVGGYAGAVDTGTRSNQVNADLSGSATLRADLSGPLADLFLRFDDVVGDGAAQVPPGAAVLEATLELSFNDPGDDLEVHAMLQPWTGPGVSYSWVGGALATRLDDSFATANKWATFQIASAGTHSVDLTALVQLWVDGTIDNNGVAMRNVGSDTYEVTMSEGVEAQRPRLVVRYTPHAERVELREGAGAYAGTDDTYVEDQQPSTAFGAAAEFIAQGAGPNPERHAMLSFDGVAAAAGGADRTLMSAELVLDVTNTGSEVAVHELLAPFVEAAETWNSLGGAGLAADGVQARAAAAASVPAGSQGSTHVPLTALAQEWVQGGAPPAVALLAGGSDSVHFRSSENSDAARRPSLRLAVCPAPCVTSPAPAPSLRPGSSGIDGTDLVLTFGAAKSHSSVAFAAGACGASFAAGPDDAELCEREYVLRRGLADALGDCGFAGPLGEEGDEFWTYRSVFEVTTVDTAAGSVFGTGADRVAVTAAPVEVRFPQDAAVSQSGEAYGPVIDLAAVSLQVANTATRVFSWTVVTSVQHPYELFSTGASATNGAFTALPLAAGAGTTCAGEGAACTQSFVLTGTLGVTECVIDSTLRLELGVRCRAGFDGACDLPERDATHFEFRVVTASVCAQVAEVAEVTPTLATFSDADRLVPSADYVLQTPLYGRVRLDIEGGVAVQYVRLERLELATGGGTVLAVDGGAAQGTAEATDGSGYSLEYTHAPGSEDGPRHDFSLQLNENSVLFAAGEGQTTLVLTAVVDVVYAAASGQQRRTRRVAVQATLAAPAPARVAASTSVGVGGAAGGAGGASGSTAGSTVLGVSAGTAVFAAIGLAAVGAASLGAAAAARRHRRDAAAKSDERATEAHATAAAMARAPYPVEVQLETHSIGRSGDLASVREAYCSMPRLEQQEE